MSYYQVNNSNKFKTELIDVSNLNQEVILHFFIKISSIKPNKFSDKIYIKSFDKEFLTNEIIKLIKEDLWSTKEDFSLDEFSIQYFFNAYNPIIKMSSFSCELKNTDGGTIVYDVVRIGKFKNEYYLFYT